MTAAAATVFSTLCAMAGATTRNGMPEIDRSAPLEQCSVSIVLVAVDPSDRVSVAVDRVTGRRGWSHCYVDPCRTRDGVVSIVDYTVRRGVHWSLPQRYASRERVAIRLDPVTASELWGCVRGRIGKAWDAGPLLVGQESAATCVGLVVACLPGAMRDRLEPLREGPCLSPNTLARFFGLTAGET